MSLAGASEAVWSQLGMQGEQMGKPSSRHYSFDVNLAPCCFVAFPVSFVPVEEMFRSLTIQGLWNIVRKLLCFVRKNQGKVIFGSLDLLGTPGGIVQGKQVSNSTSSCYWISISFFSSPLASSHVLSREKKWAFEHWHSKQNGNFCGHDQFSFEIDVIAMWLTSGKPSDSVFPSSLVVQEKIACV